MGLLLATSTSRADQARDWMFQVQQPGTYLATDLVYPGVQATLEHRMPIYGAANELDLKVNVLPTLYFVESQIDVELRALVLTLGLTAGVRDTFFNIAMEPGEDFTHDARQQFVDRGETENAITGYGEARAQLAVPFNDWVALLAVVGARYEGGSDRTFDWRFGIMRDSGVMLRSNYTLFFHHKDFGGIGPQLEVLGYDLDGKRNTGIHYGFTYVGRLGIFKRFDALLLTLLFGTVGDVNGVPYEKVYGDHWFKVPMMVLLGYRVQWELSGPNSVDIDVKDQGPHVLQPPHRLPR